MEHADTAQLAAVGGALGSVLVLLARGRLTLLAGLLRAGRRRGRAGAVARATPRSTSSPARPARPRPSPACCWSRGAAALLAWRPACVPVVVLVAAPFRPPLDFSSSNRFLVSIAEDGRLGRLLPLYFVLAAAAARARLARAARPAGAGAAAGDRAARRRLLRAGVPVAAVGRRRRGRHQPARVLHAPVRGAAGDGRPRRLPRLGAARAGGGGARARRRCSRWSGSSRW